MVHVTLEIPEPLAAEIVARLPDGETLETAALKALKSLLRDAIVRDEAAQLERARQEQVKATIERENARLGLT